MHQVKRFGLLAAGMLLVAASASATAGTGAAQPAVPLVGGTCSGSWVTVTGQQTVRSQPSASSTAMFTVVAGEKRTCRSIVVGAAYQACGVTNANGWILIQDFNNEYGRGAGWSGYIPSVCTYDGV
ncbi:MAG TPA: hypothetical protein VGD67_09325 [Pseudonocardiaceae bacterium]